MIQRLSGLESFCLVSMALLAACCGGCGNSIPTDFANRVVGANGQEIFLDDLEVIARDSALSDEEKREQLRQLGIEDEDIIEALLLL